MATVMATTNASATVGGISRVSCPPSPRTRKLYQHFDMICMLLIEWACVAGLPILLCMKIFGLPPIIQTVWPAALSVDRTGDSVGISPVICGDRDAVYEESMQSSLSVLIITSILSLAVILIFGDKDHNTTGNKRGMGIAMGSHLIPILYFTIQLFLSSQGCTELTEANQPNSDICASADAVERDCCMNFGSVAGRGLHHLQFASMSGMAFGASVLWIRWSQYNHRKYNSRRLNVDVGEDKNGDNLNRKGYSDSAMGICWKINLLTVIFQSTIFGQSSSSEVYYTPMLGFLHILLILVYDRKNATPIEDGNATIQAAWQDAFTPGEWMVVSTLITSLLGGYFFEYFLIPLNNNFISGTSSIIYTSVPIHLTVAHAGLVGCLIGVALCSLVKKLLHNSFFHIGNESVGSARKLGMVLSLIAVVGITVLCLEVALNSWVDNSDSSCAISGVESTCTNFNMPTTIFMHDAWAPLSVQWILHFLSARLDRLEHTGSTSILRLSVLGYWATILVACLPLASMLAPWIAAKDESNTNTGTHVNNQSTRDRKKRVIIARKYFHLVAILLFAPVTWLDPDMMALSYAIAIALLILLEMVRGWTITDNDTGKAGAVSDFYLIFLDEKDSSAAKGGLAVTHIALLVGCAFPLWVDQLLQTTNSQGILPIFLPNLGVTVLGIGDSAGAIGGITFGHYSWPGGSSRTLEGSFCMFLSLMIIFFVHNGPSEKDNLNLIFASVFVGMITLAEASTTQIDNLCLPVLGSTLMLLLTKFGIDY